MKYIAIVLILSAQLFGAVLRVDGNGGRGYLATQDGSAGNPYMGAYGVVRACATQAAGDTVLLYAPTANPMFTDVLVTLTVGTDKTASWVVGDSVQNTTGSGNHWTGILRELAATSIYVELRTGTYATVTTGEGVQNVTRADVNTCSARAAPGIKFATSGTIAAFMHLRGCTSNYTANALAYINGNATAAGITFNVVTYRKLSYLQLQNCVSGYTSSGNTRTILFDHLRLVGNTTGLDLTNTSVSLISFCAFNTNTTGCANGQYGSSNIYEYCRFNGNTQYGLTTTMPVSVISSIFYNSGRNHISVTASNVGTILVRGCVLHTTGNTYAGINYAATGGIILSVSNCRITNTNASATFGINATAVSKTVIEDYNYYQGYPSGAVNNIPASSSSSIGTDVDYGYYNLAAGNYNLANNATLRNVGIGLDWDTGL